MTLADVRERIGQEYDGECHLTAEEALGLAERIEAYEAALLQIDFLSTNHGAWFENDPWGWGQMMGNEARAALNQSMEEKDG